MLCTGIISKLSFPHTPNRGAWKNCLSRNQSLVPKRLGAAAQWTSPACKPALNDSKWQFLEMVSNPLGKGQGLKHFPKL